MTTSIFHLPPTIYPACYATISFLPPWSEISMDGWVSRGYEYPLQLLLGSRPPHKWLIMCDDSYAGVHPSLTYMSLEVLKTKKMRKMRGGGFCYGVIRMEIRISVCLIVSVKMIWLLRVLLSLSALEGRICIFIIWLDFMCQAMHIDLL